MPIIPVEVAVRIKATDEASARVNKATTALSNQANEVNALSRRYKNAGQTVGWYQQQLDRAVAIDKKAAASAREVRTALEEGNITKAKARRELASLARTQATARAAGRNLVGSVQKLTFGTDRLTRSTQRSKTATQQATQATQKQTVAVQKSTQATKQASTATQAYGKHNQSFIGGMKMAVKWAIAYQVAYGALDMVVQGVGQSITLASGATEAYTKNIELFGATNARAVETASMSAARIAGMNTTLYQETIGTMGAFLQAAGHTEQKSLEISQNVTQRIADIASFYNQSIEETTAKIQTVLAGTSPRPGYALGIDTTIKTMQEFMQQFDQFRGRTWKDLDLAEKQELRYLKIMQDTAKTAGDFVRTSDNFANTARIAGANIGNMGKQFGDFLIPPLQATLNLFNSLFTSEHAEGMDRFLQRVEQGARDLSEIADLPKSDAVVQMEAFFRVLSEHDMETGSLAGAVEFIEKLSSDSDKMVAAAAAIETAAGSLRDLAEVSFSEHISSMADATIHTITLGLAGRDLWEQLEDNRQAIVSEVDALKTLAVQAGLVDESIGGVSDQLVNLLELNGLTREEAWAMVSAWEEGKIAQAALRREQQEYIEGMREKMGVTQSEAEQQAELAAQKEEEMRRAAESVIMISESYMGLDFASRQAMAAEYERAHAHREADAALSGAGVMAGRLRDALLDLADEYKVKIVAEGQVDQSAVEALKTMMIAAAVARYQASGQDIEQMDMAALAAQEGQRFRDAFNAMGTLGIDTVSGTTGTTGVTGATQAGQWGGPAGVKWGKGGTHGQIRVNAETGTKFKWDADSQRWTKVSDSSSGGGTSDPFGGPKGEKWQAGEHGEIRTYGATGTQYQYSLDTKRWSVYRPKESDFERKKRSIGESYFEQGSRLYDLWIRVRALPNDIPQIASTKASALSAANDAQFQFDNAKTEGELNTAESRAKNAIFLLERVYNRAMELMDEKDKDPGFGGPKGEKWAAGRFHGQTRTSAASGTKYAWDADSQRWGKARDPGDQYGGPRGQAWGAGTHGQIRTYGATGTKYQYDLDRQRWGEYRPKPASYYGGPKTDAFGMGEKHGEIRTSEASGTRWRWDADTQRWTRAPRTSASSRTSASRSPSGGTSSGGGAGGGGGMGGGGGGGTAKIELPIPLYLIMEDGRQMRAWIDERVTEIVGR